MKTTVDNPDELFRRAKAEAAMRGESLKTFITETLADRLEQTPSTQERGWRKAFGRARPSDVADVDAIVERDLENVDPEEWKCSR